MAVHCSLLFPFPLLIPSALPLRFILHVLPATALLFLPLGGGDGDGGDDGDGGGDGDGDGGE